jgi:hypothetical protein
MTPARAVRWGVADGPDVQLLEGGEASDGRGQSHEGQVANLIAAARWRGGGAGVDISEPACADLLVCDTDLSIHISV